MELYFRFKAAKDKVCLIVSDGLYAYDEVLSTTYKQEIASFNNSSEWSEKVLKLIQERFMKVYNMKSKAADFVLVNIFILFEQDEKPIFGIQFNINLDREHGAGLKIDEKNYNVIEDGGAGVAFC